MGMVEILPDLVCVMVSIVDLISQSKFPAILLRNKLMTSEASLGLIPCNSTAGSFTRGCSE